MIGIAALARLLETLALPLREEELEARPSPGITLVDADELITVATYDKLTDAHIALGRLVAEGIEAQLFDEQMVQMDWLYAIALGGIKLRVARSDESAALKVLETDYSAILDDVDLGSGEDRSD